MSGASRPVGRWMVRFVTIGLASLATYGAGCGTVPPDECTVDDPCQRSTDCPSGQFCERTLCACQPIPCDEMSECDEDADCPGGQCLFNEETGCFCDDPETPLTVTGLVGLAGGSGIRASGQFDEVDGCPGPSSFVTDDTVRVQGPAGDGSGEIEIVQHPGAGFPDQISTGTVNADVTFFTRDASVDYDEIYIGAFERTAGTDPSAPLSAADTIARGINVNGAEGLLGPVDDARIAAAIEGGILDPSTRDAALAALLDGVTGACVLTFTLDLDP